MHKPGYESGYEPMNGSVDGPVNEVGADRAVRPHPIALNPDDQLAGISPMTPSTRYIIDISSS